MISDPQHFLNVLKNPASSVASKYKGIFELKSIATIESQNCLIESFESLDDSELLKHEIAYALGQMAFTAKIKEFLLSILLNEKEKSVVRHEAGEALANSGTSDLIPIFEKYAINYKIEEVNDTCSIGLEKLRTYDTLKDLYGKKYTKTLEPAAPFSKEDLQLELEKHGVKPDDFYNNIQEYTLNGNVSLFNRYRAMYFLRNDNSKEAINILCNLLDKKNREFTKTLLRHEVCFIFGQLEPESCLPTLEKVIVDETENEIVRHEAISAFAAISSDKKLIEKYIEDKSRIVKESCLVGLNLIDYWKN